MSQENTVTRRGLFMKLGILFNGVVAAALAVPIVGFVLSSVTRGRGKGYLSWLPLGRVSEFPEGETRLATFRNPYVTPTDGKTVDTACWVRRVGESNSRFLRSTARILAVRCVGFRNPDCLCALATEASITGTVRARRVPRSADSSNIPIKWKTVSSRFKPANCTHRRKAPRCSGRNRHAPDRTNR